ncbi:MAG: HAMP domain-containing histidine kinase [Bacteroidales bacterium]|nr:HAMP domain-containing histidine kinase [Bacteroidales bacterium]
MNKKRIQTIILITSISLIGIIVVQMYWVGNAMKLKEEQFNHSVQIALKSVVNQLLEYQNAEMGMMSDMSLCQVEKCAVIEKIDSRHFDSLMQAEMGCMRINKDYEYGIYNRVSGDFLMGQYENYSFEIRNSGYFASLGCLHRSKPYLLGAYFPNKQSIIINKLLGWMLVSILFTIVLIYGFYYSVASLFKQKKLSTMKTDFVNNMTHEFKTPISTVSLASEMLLREYVYSSPEKTKKYARIIFDENDRLKNQVEHVLQIAVLDKGEFTIKPREIDLHQVIETQVKNFRILVKERGGEICMSLSASENIINADKVHCMNIISNLIDNAVKYSPETPQIHVSTRNNDKGIFVTVNDNGIGISDENQKQVFKNLYRVPTGNIHDVKGFGLGLFYVKTMIEAHGGYVNLKSEFKKGSTFELFFPFEPKLENKKHG